MATAIESLSRWLNDLPLSAAPAAPPVATLQAIRSAGMAPKLFVAVEDWALSVVRRELPRWAAAVEAFHVDVRKIVVLERTLQSAVAMLGQFEQAKTALELDGATRFKRVEALLVLSSPSALPEATRKLLEISLEMFTRIVKSEKKGKGKGAAHKKAEGDEEDMEDDKADEEDEQGDENDDEMDVDVVSYSKMGTKDKLALAVNVLGLYKRLGASDVIEQVTISTANRQIVNNVQASCEDNLEKSALEKNKRWLFNTIVPWLSRLGVFSKDQLVAVEEQLSEVVYESLARARIDQLFDIIVDYPDSKAAVSDLKLTMEKAGLRGFLISSLKTTFERRLLHSGASTKDILMQYIDTIKTLQELDPSGICLEQVGEPVRAYLRKRNDAIRCIITSLTSDEELAEELHGAEGGAITVIDDGGQALSDYEDENWMPDPVDADLSKSSASRRSADIISKLVSIYGSKEVFVREYQNLLADRLFVLTNYDTDQEVKSVELLKLRFGDAAFHTCEVMLKDIADSKRTDHAIHQLLTEAADVPMHAQILSRLFWPSNFKKEEVTYPATLKKIADAYEAKFAVFKPQRKLEWMSTLGTVNLSLSLQDRTIDVAVPPIQAAIIGAFDGDRASATLNELANELGMNPTSLQKRIAFWVQKGVLKEDPPNTYTIVEVLASGSAANDEEDLMDTEASASSTNVGGGSGGAGEDDTPELYWLLVYNMLTNLGSMPSDRIHSMLNMFVQTPNSYEWSPQQLEAYLNRLVRDDKLVSSGGQYSIRKPAA